MTTNQDNIRFALEELIPLGTDNWVDMLAFCIGYYGEVTLDMIMVVRDLQREGKIK